MFHITPHGDWFCKYEIYDVNDVFLEDYFTTRIIGQVELKLKLIGGRIRTLLAALHIPWLARNLNFVRNLNDVSVKPMFEKDVYNMV